MNVKIERMWDIERADVRYEREGFPRELDPAAAV
jgi:hypothetical protein